MLKINGNKLSTEGVEFALPNNFYIDTEGMETTNSNGIKFVSDPKDCYINFMTSSRTCASTRDSIKQNFFDNVVSDTPTCKVIEGPIDYEHNGLKGTWIKYEVNTTCYFEIHMEKIKGFKEQAELLIAVYKSKADLETALNRPEIKDFLNSFMLHK